MELFYLLRFILREFCVCGTCHRGDRLSLNGYWQFQTIEKLTDALPLVNLNSIWENAGYSLGFWRPQDDNNFSRSSQIKKGHWDYNQNNFNALAGFLKYMPWDSQRFTADEQNILDDNRIMAYKTPKGKLVLVLTNRSGADFTFNINTGIKKSFTGYRYTPTMRNAKLKKLRGSSIAATLPDLSIEFWVEN